MTQFIIETPAIGEQKDDEIPGEACKKEREEEAALSTGPIHGFHCAGVEAGALGGSSLGFNGLVVIRTFAPRPTVS